MFNCIVEVLLLLCGVWLCLRVRKTPSAYNESKYIAWCIYNTVFTKILVGLLRLVILYIEFTTYCTYSWQGNQYVNYTCKTVTSCKQDVTVPDSLVGRLSTSWNKVSVCLVDTILSQSSLLNKSMVKCSCWFNLSCREAGNALVTHHNMDVKCWHGR
jgi:hypothetical protein